MLVFPLMSDRKGRKTMLMAAMLANLGIYTVVLFAHSYWLTVLCIFGFGLLTSVRINVGLTLLTELNPLETRADAVTTNSVFDCSVYFLGTVYFWQISKNSQILLYVGYSFNLIGLLLLSFVPESPQWLLSKGRLTDAKNCLDRIAAINGTTLQVDMNTFAHLKPDQTDQINVILALSPLSPRSRHLREKANEQQRLWAYLSNPDIKKNLIVLTLCWFCCSFNYYMVTFLFKYFPGDIYVNTSMSAFSDLISTGISGAVFAKLGARRSLQAFYLMAAVAGSLILFYEHSFGLFSN
jgi:MFS family permease